jgi:hypothetical protein
MISGANTRVLQRVGCSAVEIAADVDVSRAPDENSIFMNAAAAYVLIFTY